jgi:UDP-2,3-diacylglucosamine pyrophosphatase LpxH
MKFLKRHRIKSDKIVLVISDLHLSAGASLNGKRNLLEDFHADEELIEFLNFYSSDQIKAAQIELIINGDFLDFLAVPYVEFFDDEFWSETAAVKKLELIYHAHQNVFDALIVFLKAKHRKITYMVGNHDAELIFPLVREKLLSYFPEELSGLFNIKYDQDIYSPAAGVYIKHGHQYEFAHQFSLEEAIIETENGERYYQPPWGSYYVTQVINKYKQDRYYINQIRPIKHFLIYGLIFDTIFTLRFIFSNIYYFFMVRIWLIIKTNSAVSSWLKIIKNELALFANYEDLTKSFFEENPQAKVLIVGHTHEPAYRQFNDRHIFINTGTWTKMTNLDFNHLRSGHRLTYALVQVQNENNEQAIIDVDLYEWKGKQVLPYLEYF